ncbi:MAG TPA: hypothetical protein VI566_07470 [Xanthomonadales bacterium]|nr:hypothetical protein [Xanthomonadales bacterium]
MLLISLMTLFAGPLLYIWVFKGGRVAQAIDRLIVLALILLLVFLLGPEIIRALGWPGVVLIGLGYMLPGLLEMAVRRAAETMHLATLVLALLGLLLHALLDGAGLAGSQLQPGAGLATAIVLHRFGDGLMIWLIMSPVFGQGAAWLMLLGLSAATIAGFEFSERLLPLVGVYAVSVIQAVISGTIIHTLAHRGHVHTRQDVD